MALADFTIVKFLGKGSYGSVYKVVRKSDGKEYALKEVKIKYMSQQEREDAVNEVRILASVTHPNVIRYCESFYEQDKLYIITEFAEKGDLSNEISRKRAEGKRFDEDTIWKYFLQICVGMQAIHNKNILHRDLKCQNIFLGKDDNIKIGVAKLLKAGVTQTQVGTPYYISPEIWKKQPYNSKSDVWSLGCVLYELVTFKHPFVADSPKALANKIMTGRYQELPPNYSRDLADLVGKMLCKKFIFELTTVVVDAKRRPSIQQILEMPYIQKRIALFPKDFLVYEIPNPSKILNTIKVPKDLLKLKEQLPGPSYPSARQEVPSKPTTAQPDTKLEAQKQPIVAPKPPLDPKVLLNRQPQQPVAQVPGVKPAQPNLLQARPNNIINNAPVNARPLANYQPSKPVNIVPSKPPSANIRPDPYARPVLQKAPSAQMLLKPQPGAAPSKANLLQANKENIDKVNILREQLHQLKDRHKLIHEAINRKPTSAQQVPIKKPELAQAQRRIGEVRRFY